MRYPISDRELEATVWAKKRGRLVVMNCRLNRRTSSLSAWSVTSQSLKPSELLTLSDRCSAERHQQFWLVDVRELGHIHPGARRQAGSWPLSTKHWGTVAFGVGFTQRLFARLLLGAAKVLRGEVETVVLLSEEEEARTWISQERLRRQAATST